jgi:hypothetical protein
LLRVGGLKFAMEGDFALDLKRHQEKTREIEARTVQKLKFIG